MKQRDCRHSVTIDKGMSHVSLHGHASKTAIKWGNSELNAKFQCIIKSPQFSQNKKARSSFNAHAHLLKYGYIPVKQISGFSHPDSRIAQALRQHILSKKAKPRLNLSTYSFMDRIQATKNSTVEIKLIQSTLTIRHH